VVPLSFLCVLLYARDIFRYPLFFFYSTLPPYLLFCSRLDLLSYFFFHLLSALFSPHSSVPPLSYHPSFRPPLPVLLVLAFRDRAFSLFRCSCLTSRPGKSYRVAFFRLLSLLLTPLHLAATVLACAIGLLFYSPVCPPAQCVLQAFL